MLVRALTAALVGLMTAGSAWGALPWRTVDLAERSTSTGILLRMHGAAGPGAFGVPVASGHDTDGDGHVDYAMAAMLASPLSRSTAGLVHLRFGDGSISGTFDTAFTSAGRLDIVGATASEMAGSEIWMDDVTGDGLGDLLIARQNYSPEPGRIGAGALTILVGSAALKTRAATLQPIDLANPPAGIELVTLLGPSEMARLGIWMRTGDVTGDGVADIVVGADQESEAGIATHEGAVYVVRGGSHLLPTGGAIEREIDLSLFPASSIAGHVKRIRPPAGSSHYHLGATVQIADLDDNGTAEVLAAAALNRAGADVEPDNAPSPTHASGGSLRGTLYIAWDDNFTGNPWVSGLDFRADATPGSETVIDGNASNREFGEELLGGLDYDADGNADLFVGDITGDTTGSRPSAGIGHVFFRAADLRNLSFDMDSIPGTLLPITTFQGGATGDIAADTALHGDFDGDGIADLGICTPHATVEGRSTAGAIHVFHGRSAGWPGYVDLGTGQLVAPELARISLVEGARGFVPFFDSGDTLCYSAASGDVDGDGRSDLVVNEMEGNGIHPSAIDVGNLIVLSGATISWPATPSLAPVARLALIVLLAALAWPLRPRR